MFETWSITVEVNSVTTSPPPALAERCNIVGHNLFSGLQVIHIILMEKLVKCSKLHATKMLGRMFDQKTQICPTFTH